MERLIDKGYKWLVRFSSFKTFLLFLVLFIASLFTIATVFHRGHVSPRELVFAGIVPLYSADQIYAAMEHYFAEGARNASIYATFFDIFVLSVVWPIFFAVTYIWTFRKLFPRNIALQKGVLLIPLVGFFLDEIQNVAILIVYLAYPTRIDWLAGSLSYLTNILWTVIIAGFILIGVGLIGVIGKKIFKLFKK